MPDPNPQAKDLFTDPDELTLFLLIREKYYLQAEISSLTAILSDIELRIQTKVELMNASSTE